MKDFNLEKFPRIKICSLPTPIEHLERLSNHLGMVNIYLKRDDLTGIAFGGNKNRKLEFLLADAQANGAEVVITEGAVTSNHCLQTAACAAKVGLDCHLILSDAFIGEEITGNLLLDYILEVKIHRVETSDERKKKMLEVAKELEKGGKKPYIIPTGGSNKIGILGYVNFIKEIASQSQKMGIKFDTLVHGAGSAGTQAGILIGKKIYYPELEVFGISAGDSKEEIKSTTEILIKEFEVEHSLNLNVDKNEIIVLEGYFGEGYGIPSKELISIVKLVAQLEGVFLDPVYNGKAMIGLIDLIKNKKIKPNSNILFLHSGGGPAIFSYKDYFK